MKKLNLLFILAAGLTLTLSCNRDEGRFEPEVEQFKTVTITAGAADTRTVLDGTAVKWENGDEVALVFPHSSKTAHVETFATSLQSNATSATFKGTLPADVLSQAGGYDENAYAVYPVSAVTTDGSVRFTLPAEQRVRANGTFASGLNLTSAAVSLEDLQKDGKASAAFHNALSILRFPLPGDVTSVTLTGTAPLAGTVPFVVDHSKDGRLLIDSASLSSSDKQTSVVLKPADGSECFTKGAYVNLLVLPGTHSSMTVKLTTKSLGDFTKTSTQRFSFEASKYYTLNFNVNTDALVEELTSGLNDLEQDLSDIENQLAGLETNAEKISALVDQIQSVALMSEYVENAVYAYYANQSVGMLKMDVNLHYMVRPAAAMSYLLAICKEEGNLSQVLSILRDDQAGNFSNMTVKDAMLDGDILTVVVDAAQLDKNFYDGRTKASLALQISDGNTDVLSDFAYLIPKVGNVLNLSRIDNIPVLKGASFSMSYQYGAEDYSKCQVSVEGTGFSSAPTVSANNGSGYISANFSESANLANMSITVTLKYDGNVVDERTLTFADGGVFSVATPNSVDYIGGEVAVNVTSSSFDSYNMHLSGAGDWIYETSAGVSGRYTLNQNTGSQRSANVVITINNGNVSYSKTVTITQKASGTSLTGSYYSNGERVLLNQKTSSCANALNIVILGDGYQKKDLLKGGKFERSARSAMDSFFGIEPYKTFKDRFNVYMVAYESTDEGIDNKAAGVNKNTYFNTYCEGGDNTAAYADESGVESIKTVVKNTVGSSDAQYYRTIAIVLANTSEQAGSCGYPYRERYNNTSTLGEEWASFSICVLAANSTGTNGLVKHEAGGHAFGRLADEYYKGGTITSAQVAELAKFHAKGWYFNVCTDRSYWNLFIGKAGYEDVSYIEGAWGYAYGVYRPTQGGMMQNNAGVFNAPSRRAIYQRIIRQTEGYNAYSDAKFFEYDRRNVN